MEWTSIAAASLLVLFLLALGLMQATGLVDLFAPIADTEIGQRAAFAVLALLVVALFLWGRRRV